MRCLALTQSTEQRASERGPVTDLAALGADEQEEEPARPGFDLQPGPVSAEGV